MKIKKICIERKRLLFIGGSPSVVQLPICPSCLIKLMYSIHDMFSKGNAKELSPL